jgi:hypothetical protein
MEGELLNLLGGSRAVHKTRPVQDLADVDSRASFLRSVSIEKSTNKGYQTGARDYVTFCMNHHLPLDPTPVTLSRYIAYSSQFIASGPKYLSGARHFLRDIYSDFDKNRGHPLVQSTIRGAKKVRADPVRWKLPLRLSHLEASLQLANNSNHYDDLLFATILSCGFYACHRMGELVIKSDRSQFDWRKIIRRSSLVFENNRAQYHLPYHKADPFYRGTTILFSQQDVADPVALLKRYVGLRDFHHHARLPLFLREDGSIPSRSWFFSKFHSSLSHDYGGQSVRAGGATFYASLGLSESVIQAIGRWTSAAWKIYIRDNPTIRAEQQLASLRMHYPSLRMHYPP